jgi:HK97 gp10 family phage protein
MSKKTFEIKLNKGDLANANKLLKKAKGINVAVKNEVAKTIMSIAKTSVQNAPVNKNPKMRGGGLRQSVKFGVQMQNAFVEFSKKYAPYVEFGTGRFVSLKFLKELGIPEGYAKQFKGSKAGYMPPQPFLFPAVKQHIPKFISTIKSKLKRIQ